MAKDMVIKLSVLLFSFVLLFCFVSCEDAENKFLYKECRILFIGNSFTYTNNLPDLLTKCIESDGYKVNADSVTAAGYTLERFCNPNDNYCSLIETYLANNKYDYVIIQEYSTRPITEYDQFRAAAKTIVKKVRKNGAIPLFYETWGYGEGNTYLQDNNWTTTQMEELLLDAYTKLGKELNVKVVRCGSIFNNVYQKNKDIPLYAEDLRHPGIGGSYLVALTFFNYIYKTDVTTLTYNPETLDSAMGQYLREEVMSFFNNQVIFSKL